MILRREHGTKEDGTYTLKLSHSDIGFSNINMFFDYYMEDQKKYRVDISITKINKDVAFLIEQQGFNCNYSELDEIFKEYFKKNQSHIRETLIAKSKSIKNLPEKVFVKIEGPLGSIYTSNNDFKELFVNKLSANYLINSDFQLNEKQQLVVKSNFRINYDDFSESVDIQIVGNERSIKEFITGLDIGNTSNYSYEICTYRGYTTVYMDTKDCKKVNINIFTNVKNRLDIILKAIGCKTGTAGRYIEPNTLFERSIDEFTYEDFNDLFSLDEEAFSSVISAAIKRA